MSGFRFHYSSGRGPAAGGVGKSLLKVFASLLIGAVILVVLVASATVILAAVAAAAIAFIGFAIRRAFRRGPLPQPERKEEAQPLIREASPACPHCGAGLRGQLSGNAGSAVNCPGCGESVRDSDVVYTVDPR